ncbi:pyridoxamine 5'-phosphate oxidase family protein [Motilibacter deserti]|uniref:pyridoxamine 5'-phosphate oxidase family protein n=1 Tax=Motilibacter deserti TaxID=2714956 RepID=UPI0018C8A646|nr:pyridoxamine 5'-phosphate oxidase family protein [Motilibacter deserti]
MRDRVTHDGTALYGFLDSEYLGHLAWVARGAPQALPMLYARDGDRLLLHGSTGGAAALAARGTGIAAGFTVTTVDGLVLARSAMHHSVNFRCAVVHGTLSLMKDEASKRAAFDALLEAVSPGRSRECRPADAKELAATAVLALDIEEASLKQRAGGVADDEADLTLPYWAGVVPLRTTQGPPVPAPGVPSGAALPAGLVFV